MNLVGFPENLKRALQENGLTQKNLAELLDTTQATVSRWLHGVNEPDMAVFLEICLYLNETPSSLLGYDDIPNETINSYYNSAKKFNQ